jgi:hypothetical protein
MDTTGPEVAGQHVEVEAKAATVEALESRSAGQGGPGRGKYCSRLGRRPR